MIVGKVLYESRIVPSENFNFGAIIPIDSSDFKTPISFSTAEGSGSVSGLSIKMKSPSA